MADEDLGAGSDALGEGVEVVAAFEDEDEATFGVAIGEGREAAAEVGEAFFGEAHAAEGITRVGVETCRDEDEIGREVIERGEDEVVVGGGEVAVA